MQTQRFSYQREQIYQAVCGARDHPTAEMVYTRLKPEMPRLSLGTVYRNLHQMAQDGRLTEINDTVVRFDADTLPHSHYRCRGCGAVADLPAMPYDPELDRQAARGGWQVANHSLVFHGICPSCLGKNKEEQFIFERGIL